MTIRGEVRIGAVGHGGHRGTGPGRRRSALVLALALVGLTAPGGAALVRAQALDDEMLRLLGNNCEGLDFPRQGTIPGQFGPELSEICRFPPTTSGSSSGGGAASTQGSALSIQNSVVQARLERARAGKDRAGSAPRTSWLSGKRAWFADSGWSADPQTGGVTYADLQAGEATGGSGAGLRSNRFDVFASASYDDLDRNSSRFEDGFESSVFGGTVGFDYQFTDTFVGGFAAGYRTHDGDYSTGGNFEMSAIEPSFYASWLPTRKTWLQFVVGYSTQDFDVDRIVNFTFARQGETPAPVTGPVSSGTDSNVYNASAQFGYDIPKGKVTFGPRVGVNYSKTNIDGYSESGSTGLELRVDDRSVTSFQATAGIYGTMALSGKSAVWLPQGSLEYVAEFEDEASILTAHFVQDTKDTGPTPFNYQTNVPDSGFVNAEVGVSAVFRNGIQGFFNLRTMLGNSTFDSFGATAGVRFEL